MTRRHAASKNPHRKRFAAPFASLQNSGTLWQEPSSGRCERSFFSGSAYAVGLGDDLHGRVHQIDRVAKIPEEGIHLLDLLADSKIKKPPRHQQQTRQ